MDFQLEISQLHYIQRLIKTALRLLFVDLEPNQNNKDIFSLKSLCYTKIKVEARKFVNKFLSVSIVRIMITYILNSISNPTVSSVVNITVSNLVQKVPNFQLNALTAEMTIQKTTVNVQSSNICNDKENNSLININTPQKQKKALKHCIR